MVFSHYTKQKPEIEKTTQILILKNNILLIISLIKTNFQAIGILEKSLDTVPASFYDDPGFKIRNEIINGLYHCLNNPLEEISLSALK